jgi:hypothetical protein
VRESRRTVARTTRTSVYPDAAFSTFQFYFPPKQTSTQRSASAKNQRRTQLSASAKYVRAVDPQQAGIVATSVSPTECNSRLIGCTSRTTSDQQRWCTKQRRASSPHHASEPSTRQAPKPFSNTGERTVHTACTNLNDTNILGIGFATVLQRATRGTFAKKNRNAAAASNSSTASE